MNRAAKLMMLVGFCALVGAIPLEEARARQPRPRFEDIVKIEFPKDGYSFTLAEVARGVKLPYKIVIAEDYEGVIPTAHGPSFQDPAGPSGLHPQQQITGDKQFYCLVDFGLAIPPKEVVKPLKKGVHEHSFEWDGRNWSGPSDFNNPKGKAFPAGTYDVIVNLRGKVNTEKGAVPYLITRKTKLVLK